MIKTTGKPKRGKKYLIDGKEWFLYIIKSDNCYLMCDNKSFGLGCNYVEFNPGSLIPIAKERTTVKRVSDKQEKINRLYSVISSQFKKNNPICQIRVKCNGSPTEDVHHPDGRIGERLLDDSQFIATCRACHIWAETHPKEAKELGVSKSRLQTKKS